MQYLTQLLTAVAILVASSFSHAQCGGPVPKLCDANGDRVVDQKDISAISIAKGSPATGSSDLRDLDGDGVISVLDARQCVAKCDEPKCAVPELGQDNKPPVAFAEASSTAATGLSKVILDGSKSSDPDGTIKSYSWEQLSGPHVELQSASDAIAHFIVPSVSSSETAALRLTVIDDQNVSATDDVSIVIEPIQPSLLEVKFIAFRFYEPFESEYGHADQIEVERPLIANETIIAEAALGGLINEVTFEFRNVSDGVATLVSLIRRSSSSNPPFYYGGNVIIPSEPFVVVAKGTTLDGQTFEVALDGAITPIVGDTP